MKLLTPFRSLLNYYYAYRIRNSFGVDFDPVRGKLRDTENGPTFGDEINLVNPGFNRGWIKIQGLAHDANNGDGNPAKGLVTFGGKGYTGILNLHGSQQLVQQH